MVFGESFDTALDDFDVLRPPSPPSFDALDISFDSVTSVTSVPVMVMSNSDTKTHTTTGEGGESVTKVENGTKNAGPNKRKSKKVQPSDGSVSWELAEEVVEGRCLAVMADLEDKIKSDRFTKEFIKQLSGNALSVAHFQVCFSFLPLELNCRTHTYKAVSTCWQRSLAYDYTKMKEMWENCLVRS